MMVFKKYIQRPLLLSCILFLVTTVVFFPVSAADDHPNYFYDFDDYASYSSDSTTDLISADIKLPSDWLWLCAIDGNGHQSWYNGTDYVVIEPSTSPYSWRFNPFFRFNAVNPSVGHQLHNARFLDLNFIPNGAYFDLEFYYTISSGNDSTYRLSDMFLVYVDRQGLVVRTDRIVPSFTATSVQSSVTRYDVSARYYFSNVPQNAEGFYYAISIQHGFADVGIDIPVSSVANKLTFKYSELDFNIKQNQVIRDKVSNIENQLGDLITGTPEQNEEVNGAVDQMQQAGDDLKDLGSSMSNVPKPDPGDINVSIDQFVSPGTMLAYTQPFLSLWENPTMLSMLIIVLTLVLVSWVMFGKKGG